MKQWKKATALKAIAYRAVGTFRLSSPRSPPLTVPYAIQHKPESRSNPPDGVWDGGACSRGERRRSKSTQRHAAGAAPHRWRRRPRLRRRSSGPVTVSTDPSPCRRHRRPIREKVVPESRRSGTSQPSPSPSPPRRR